MKSFVVKRSIVIGDNKTSVTLEDEFWNGLKQIADKELTTRSALVKLIDTNRKNGNLSSAIRLFVFNHFRSLGESKPTEGELCAHAALQERRHGVGTE